MVNFLLILGLERREREEETPQGSRDPAPTSSLPRPGLAATPLLPWGSSGHSPSRGSHYEPPSETVVYFPLGKFQCPRRGGAAGPEGTRGAWRDSPGRRRHAPVPQLPVLQLQAAVQGLQAAVLADERLVLGGLPLVQCPQALVVLQQCLVGGRQLLLLLPQALVLALLGRLLALQQCVLGAERGALGGQRGVLHLPRGRRGRRLTRRQRDPPSPGQVKIQLGPRTVLPGLGEWLGEAGRCNRLSHDAWS